MDLNLSGKVTLVTGASRGIGLEIAMTLAAQGCRVALNGRDKDRLVDAAGQLEEPPFIAAGDVSRPEGAAAIVERTIAHFGRLDIVVANVGGGSSVPAGEESFDEWQRVFALNLWSTTNIVEAARARLAQSAGCVICISSICGMGVVAGAPVTYSVAKAALNAYIKGIAQSLGEQGVRIAGVAPGNILFPGSVWDRKLGEDAAAVEAMLRKAVPAGRLGTPREIADLVACLASDRFSFASGCIWPLDGGQIR